MTKKIKLIIILITVIQINLIYGQSEGVSINTTNNSPHASAILDVQHDNKGILIPRVSLLSLTSQTTPVENPAEGLLIYNDDSSLVPKGFYFWTGSMWNQFTTQGNIQLNLDGNNLSITGGDPINLSQINTDNQDLSLSGNILSLTNDNTTVDLTNIKLQKEIAIFEHRVGNTIPGGTAIANTWNTRILNYTAYISGNSINRVSSTTFTLAPGKYHIVASAPAYMVNRHQIRLYNITDNTIELIGTSEFAGDGGYYSMTSSWIDGIIQIEGSIKSFEIQHYVNLTNAPISNQSFGLETTSPGIENIYTRIRIEKID